MKNEQKLCQMFRVKDISFISKRQLGDSFLDLHERYSAMILELFFANPDHKFFEAFDEMDLAKLRVERIKRLSQKPRG